MKNSPNLLAYTKCYLVGGMQNFQNGYEWRDVATKFLDSINVRAFNPYKKPFISSEEEGHKAHATMKQWMETGQYAKVAKRMKKIRANDLRLCDLSDFFIAFISPSVASFGSAEELVQIVRQKKPVFIVVDGGKKKTPYWLMGMLPHHYFYDSFNQAFDMIAKIDSGEKKIDSDRWQLLRKECR